MKIIKGKLIARIKRTDTVDSFRIVPQERVSFFPGQFLQIIFDEGNPRNLELNKYLSFSCSPTKDYIEVTKKLSSSIFSDRLRKLKANDTLSFKAPLGNCIFKDDYKKIAFLIGGIGITPVISILGYIMDMRLGTDAILFYSNKTEDDVAFINELDNWQAKNANFKIIYTVTAREPVDKRCIKGTINKNLVLEKLAGVQDRIFYAFGPPAMVEAMKNLCLGLGVKAENIKTENFLGY